MTHCKINSINNIPNKNPKRYFGVTLVELMIAITIGSIVALGIGSVYTSSKRSYKLQEEFSRLQENGRFAMNFIARFVRGAGYYGCSSALGNMINNIEETDEGLLFQTGIEGFEAAGTAPSETVSTLAEYPSVTTTSSDFASITSDITSTLIGKLKPLPHTDILVARSGESSGIEIVTNNDSATFRITYTGGVGGKGCGSNVDKLSGICAGDSLLISDCKKSVAFVVTSTNYMSGATPPDVKINHSGTTTNGKTNDETSFQAGAAGPEFEFEVGSEIVRMTTKIFYIGKGVTGPALFVRDDIDASGQELVEGVENLQILYGEDMDADNVPDHYVPADKVANFADVTALHISILLRSVKNLPWRTTTQATRLLGGTTAATATTITPPVDKRLRKVMSMTIKLRNRAFTL